MCLKIVCFNLLIQTYCGFRGYTNRFKPGNNRCKIFTGFVKSKKSQGEGKKRCKRPF